MNVAQVWKLLDLRQINKMTKEQIIEKLKDIFKLVIHNNVDLSKVTLETKIINGRKYILVPAGDGVIVNGVDVNINE